MTPSYPTPRDRRAINLAAEAGDESAKKYLMLLDVCALVLTSSDGIGLASGLMGENDDVYGHAVDDALAELVPVILDTAAGGWDSLTFYARTDQLPPAPPTEEPAQ